MSLFGPSQKEVDRDQAIFELMVLIMQVDGSLSENEIKGVGLKILELSKSYSLFESWIKKGQFKGEIVEEAAQKYQAKTISGESGSSILSSIEPLLDDYKDAIPKKHRQNAFKMIMSAAGADFEFHENEIALLEIIASKFKIKDKKFNRFYKDAQNVAEYEKSAEQELFMEELSKIPGLSKKQLAYIGEEFDYASGRFEDMSADELRELVPGLKRNVADAIIRRFC